jgi:hypothetical protein
MLSETNRIDIIAQSPEGEIILVITAAEDWSDEHALELLSDKIDTYVSFIKDPQFQDEYGSATAYIELVAMHEPTSQVQELLDAASAATGIRIGIRKMEIDIEGLLGGEPADPPREPAPSRRAKEKEKPPRSEAPSKAASKEREKHQAGRPSAPPASLDRLMSDTGLDCVEIDSNTLAVPLEGERVDQIVIQAQQLDEELAMFAVLIPEPSQSEREAALESILRTTFSANYVKALSSGAGQLLWAVELPTALLTPAVAEGVVKGLGRLADATEEDLADSDASQARALECRMAQAAHITVDVVSAEREIRAELEAAGLATKREFEDAVVTHFAKVGDAEIDLLARFHERAVSFIVYLPGLQPRGDKEAYLERVLKLNADANVAKIGIDDDGDLAILYEIPGFSKGMFREVATQLQMLFKGVLEVHAGQ